MCTCLLVRKLCEKMSGVRVWEGLLHNYLCVAAIEIFYFPLCREDSSPLPVSSACLLLAEVLWVDSAVIAADINHECLQQQCFIICAVKYVCFPFLFLCSQQSLPTHSATLF